MMKTDMENIQQAKKSFNSVLANSTYAGIIKDDKHLEVLLNLVKDGKHQEILDIGTGTGYLAFPLAEMFPEAKVCGIDIADAIVEKNNTVVKERGIPNLSFQAFDGLQYPFEAETFDLIVTRYAFHHFPNVEDAIRQMHRILAKGGRVLISDPMKHAQDSQGVIDDFMSIKKDGHIQFYSAKELEELFLRNGFEKEQQVITDMKFPFPPKQEYLELYDKTVQSDREYYDIAEENNIVWVKQIKVGNTVFVKK